LPHFIIISDDSKCGTNESIAIGDKGMIRSPNYPYAYKNLDECEWLISVPVGFRIKLEFLDLEVSRTYILYCEF